MPPAASAAAIPYQPDAAAGPSWQQVEDQVIAGLPGEKPRLDSALVASDYYHLRNKRYIQRRDGEGDADFANRPKRIVPFARRVVQVLAKHLYSPGPLREVKGDAATSKWLNGVYADCLVNSLWQRADRLSTLGGAAAIQVSTTGDPARPVKLQLWAPEEFAVYPDCGTPELVVTMDKYDNQRRYTLWSKDQFRVYQTGKGGHDITAGGTVARPVGPPRANPYGVLPFAFQHAELPVSSFWEGGIGDYLSHVNGAADDELSDLANAIKRFAYPLGVLKNADPDFQVINKMGAFVRLSSILQELGKVPEPELSYLQAQLDIVGTWAHIENALYQALEDLGIPRQAWRMESAQVASGIALVAEQLPLYERAQERREPQRVYETDLARVVLAVAGGYRDDRGRSYKNAEALRAAAEDLELVLTWPELSIPIPGPDRDDADQHALDMGLKSKVMILCERFGLTRDQAIARLKQIKKDNDETAEIEGPPEAPDPAAGVAGDGNGSPQDPAAVDPDGPDPLVTPDPMDQGDETPP
jgi:hypothetical protein